MIAMFHWFLAYIPVLKRNGIYHRICVQGFISRLSTTTGFSHPRSKKDRCICSRFAVLTIRIRCEGEFLDSRAFGDLSETRQRTKDVVSERALTLINTGKPSTSEQCGIQCLCF